MNAPVRGPDEGLEENGAVGGQGSSTVGSSSEFDAAGKRRHERITAPLDVIFQRKIYKAKDWSMTGFALDPTSFDLSVGQRFRFHARFHLRGAQMAAEFQAEVARRTGERVGCRFIDVTPDQIQVLRMLLASHRSGRAPAWEAMMSLDEGGPLRGAAHGRVGGGAATARVRAEGADKGTWYSGGRLSWRPNLKLIYGVLALVALVVVGLVGLIRLLPDAESAFAAVSLPGGQTLAAKKDGTVVEVLAAPGDLVGVQTIVLRLSPTGGDAEAQSPVLSPCACSVLSLAVSPGDVVAAGDPLMSLGPIDAPQGGLLVEALFPIKDLTDLSTGTQLDVRLAGTNRLVRGRVIAKEGGGLSVLPQVLDDREGLGIVHVGLDQQPEGLYNGQPARVRLRRSLLALLGL
ncbi:HlyD family efflux transporter periplasmic adaptor subunit [Rhodospirillum sp. A1_3_36]|uniref:HlyD family efflux transporter periplasmic adaptor subunit n=1 Tax=Rhodospirillum sp. A1_3_36 TaxID=3391666 RepID=UPI0039A5E710